MNNTIPFHSAPHAPQITVDVNILTMLKQAASCLTEAAGRDVYLAAIGPDMELTIIMEEDAPSVLPCFDEDDALITVKGAPLFISYNPAQVLKLAGKRYLTGPVIFYRTDGHSTIVSLTVEDIYRFQTYLESHSTTLMADGQKLTCIYEKMFSMGIRSLSAYIRKMALDGYCLNLDLPQLRRMAYLLQMCSNNLNQYTKAANENGRVYAADMEDLRQRLDELIEIGRQILSRLTEL